MFHINEKIFFQYIKCPNWVYFDVHGSAPRPHDELMARLADDGLLPEKQRELISDREDVAEVTAEDQEEAFRQTLSFMREGRQCIYQGVLIDKHWIGHPDLLERVEGRSVLGDYYYIAADIKHSRFLRDDHKFQGCFYAELLERIQGVKPVQGYVITPDNETLSYLIEEFEAEFSLTLTEIEKIIAGVRPAHFVTSGCKQSPWFDECLQEARTCEDISLLNRVWRVETARLKEAGIETISQLAVKSVAQLEALAPSLNPKRLEIMRDQAIAIREGRDIIRQKAELPEADVEIFFDIESDPLRDFDYLFGCLSVSENTKTYHAFFAESPSSEEMMWREFVSFVEQNISSPIYHYGWFEREVVSRFSARYGISEIAREALERNMIDILEIVRASVIFPLSFYSLKDIAAYIGFKWRSADASGANSVMWFEEWLKDKSRKKLLQKILDYNEDDVLATHALQRWIRENASL